MNIHIVNHFRKIVDGSEDCMRCKDDIKSKAHLRRLLVAFSRSKGLLPRSLFLDTIENRDENLKSARELADIFQASHNGQVVALKRHRLWMRPTEKKRRMEVG